jgi:hypothetical protein
MNTVLVTEREDGTIKVGNITSSLSSVYAAFNRETSVNAVWI